MAIEVTSEALVPRSSRIVTFHLAFIRKDLRVYPSVQAGWTFGEVGAAVVQYVNVSLGDTFVLLLLWFFTHFELSVERRTFCLFLLTFALQVM